MNFSDVDRFAIPLAQTAGLADQEARWRFDLMMQEAHSQNPYANMEPFVDLQRRRTRFAELGPQLEQFASAISPGFNRRDAALLSAADAYRSAGDQPNEMRVLSTVSAEHLDNLRQQRLFELLLARQPAELVRIAATWTPTGERAAEYVVANAAPIWSHAVVQARSRPRPPVWNKSYNALVGLYFAEPATDVRNAFLGALGDTTIGERLGKPVDRSQQLAGDIWFYYGSRYGEYLWTTKQGNPEDFLPAILEQSPATSSGYLTLADYYADTGDEPRAILDYNHTLELTPNRPDVYDNLALAYYKQGDHAAALAQWKQAFAVLSGQINAVRVPEAFWADFGRTCDQLAARHVFSDLKPDADAIVRAYLRHNGNYRSNAVLHSAYAAAGDPAAATAWLLDLSSAAHDPSMILADVADASWIPLAQRAAIYQRILEVKQDSVSKLTGLERDNTQQELNSWQVRWIQYLVRTKQYAQASAAIPALPKETRDAQAAALVPLDLRIAAQLGTLDSKLASYRSDPQSTPTADTLRAAARQLFEAGDKQSARNILELVFAREIEDHQLVAANFLGLAEIRIASGDTSGALDLLRRLVVVVGNPFENLDPAAAMLEKTGHNTEAVEFLDQLVKSAPWDPSYRLRLAKAKLAAGQDTAAAQDALSSVASGSSVPYDLRIKATLALAGRPHSDLGSGELNLLAGNPTAVPASAADQSYFYDARIKAAQNAADTQTRVQLLSHCASDFPRRDEARIPLFQAAVSAQSNEFAVAVLEPLLQMQFLHNHASGTGTEEEEIISSDSDEEDNSGEPSIPATAGLRLSRAQHAQVARMIGDTMIHLNRFPDAVPYFDAARRLESSAPTRRELARKLAELRATLRIQTQNAARQPLLHEALEQDRVVRPRLLARTAVPNAAAAKGGVKP